MVSCWSHSYLCIALKCQSCQALSTHFPCCFLYFLLFFISLLALFPHTGLSVQSLLIWRKKEESINNRSFFLCVLNIMIFISSRFTLSLHICLCRVFSSLFLYYSFFLILLTSCRWEIWTIPGFQTCLALISSRITASMEHLSVHYFSCL